MQCNIYRIMLEPEAFLQSSGRRRLKSEFIIRLNAPFHCFRTSRSLLWPLKWNCRFLFVIMTPCFTSVACLERCINTIYVQCYQSVDFPYGIWQPLIYKLPENKHGVMFLYIIYNNSQGHPTSFFGKYLFGRRFEIQNFRNIFCKISCLPALPLLRFSNV